MASKTKRLFRSYVFDGLLMIALGVMLLIWPQQSLKALCIIIGAVLALLGVIKIIAFITNKNGDRNILDIPVGIIQIVAGGALIIRPGFFINFFQIIIGVLLAYGAVTMIVRAIQLFRIGGFMLVISVIFAVIMAALAVIILVNPPAFASFMTQLEGISLIVEGLALIIALVRIRAERQTEDRT